MAARYFVELGEMPRQAYLAYAVVLECSNEHGKDVDLLTIRQLGERVGWAERTMAEWLRWLYDPQHRWLAKAHRSRQNKLGYWRGLPNVWRPSRPAAAEEYLVTVSYLRDSEQGKGKGKGKGKGGPTPKAPQNRPKGPRTTTRPPAPARALPAAAEASPAPTAPRTLAEVRALAANPKGRRRAPP